MYKILFGHSDLNLGLLHSRDSHRENFHIAVRLKTVWELQLCISGMGYHSLKGTVQPTVVHPKCSRVKTCIQHVSVSVVFLLIHFFCLFVCFYYVFIDLLIQSVRKIYVSQKLVSYVNPWKIPVLKLWYSQWLYCSWQQNNILSSWYIFKTMMYIMEQQHTIYQLCTELYKYLTITEWSWVIK